MNLQSLMIRASAGSGKTYQLANRFLALLTLGVEPGRIIALTFTRKAAGEFADRIMHRLAKGAGSVEEAETLALEMRRTLEGDVAGNQPGLLPAGAELPNLSQERFRELLVKLVESMDRLALGTFDSFFSRIARTSCHDLGLGGFALLDEADLKAEKERTFTRIFSRLGKHSGQRETFLEAFKQATLGVEEIKFIKTLEEFIKDYHMRYVAQPDVRVWGEEVKLWPQGPPWPEIKDFAQRADAIRTATEGRDWGHKTFSVSWMKMLDWLEQYQIGQTKKIPSAFEDMVEILPDLAAGVASFEYSRKTMTISSPLAEEVAAIVGGVIMGEIRQCLNQTKGLHSVMESYEKLYGKDVRQRGKLGFADLTLVLAQAGIGSEGLGQNIGYRLDQWFDHWMLDEFQDTDRAQWKVLEGLIQEVQQDEEGKRTFFVVGDPKQGVHAWRGGEPRLFDEIAMDWQGRLPEWAMDKSYRSAPQVLSLVNHVCDRTKPWMLGRFPQESLERWKFSEHAAGKEGISGESLVLAIPENDEAETGSDDDDFTNLKGTWPAIAAILKEYQPLKHGRTCAVLVETNKETRGIADYLRHKLPDEPVEVETETPMAADGPVGAALMDLFRWLHAPADSLAWGHVLYSPLYRAILEVMGVESPQKVWEVSREWVYEIGISGYLVKIAGGIRKGYQIDPFNGMRLESWLQEARVFDDRGGTLADWLRHLEEWKSREYSQAGAIQIMTVHKSKGLEFDMVIVPETGNKAFDNSGKLEILSEQRNDGTVEFLTVAPRKIFVSADESLTRMHDKWCADQCYEKFCNLYVAMTRAKHALFMLVPQAKPSKGNKPKECKRTYTDWVMEATASLPKPSREFSPDGLPLEVLWYEGDAGWLSYGLLEKSERAAKSEIIPLLPSEPRMERRTPSAAKMTEKIASGHSGKDRREAMDFGSSVHAAFEAIGWVDEGWNKPSDLGPEVTTLVERCLASAQVRNMLTRPAGDVRLFREQAFDLVSENTWMSGVIDRMHVWYKDGKCVRAEIVDFKTDAVEKADELIGKYREQMRAYAKAMAVVWGIEMDNITCRILSTSLAEVIAVEL